MNNVQCQPGSEISAFKKFVAAGNSRNSTTGPKTAAVFERVFVYAPKD